MGATPSASRVTAHHGSLQGQHRRPVSRPAPRAGRGRRNAPPLSPTVRSRIVHRRSTRMHSARELPVNSSSCSTPRFKTHVARRSRPIESEAPRQVAIVQLGEQRTHQTTARNHSLTPESSPPKKQATTPHATVKRPAFHVQRSHPQPERDIVSSINSDGSITSSRNRAARTEVYASSHRSQKFPQPASQPKTQLETLDESYPPRQVRWRRYPDDAFLSAVSEENVQPPRHGRAVVHDLSTEVLR
jgi:hypothetical protein